MLCERCNEQNANIHITKIDDGKKTEINLCEQCAIKEGILYSFKPKATYSNGKKVERCPVCGLTEDIFLAKGLFGCSKCYDVFEGQAQELVKALQGTSSHRGKNPETNKKEKETLSEIDELKITLAEAIEEERYEQAVVLRDKIKALNSMSEKPKKPEEG